MYAVAVSSDPLKVGKFFEVNIALDHFGCKMSRCVLSVHIITSFHLTPFLSRDAEFC